MAKRLFVSCVLLLLLGIGSAQLFGRRGAPPAPQGAGQAPADVICADQGLQTFCNLIKAARRDPEVSDLFEPTFVGTIFAPLDEGISSDKEKLARELRVPSFDAIITNPQLAARVVNMHIIVGQALQFAQLRNDQKYVNAIGQTLEIDTGTLGGAGSLLGGLYIKGPKNTVRLRSTQGYNNILAGRAYIHKINGIIIPQRA